MRTWNVVPRGTRLATPRRLGTGRGNVLGLFAALFIGTSLALLPSVAEGAVVIEHNFPSGSGTLTVTLDAYPSTYVLSCTSSMAGTTSTPSDANAKLTSWTLSSCTMTKNGASLGTADVTALSLPTIKALGTNVVTLGGLNIRAKYSTGGSTCYVDIGTLSWPYSYSAGATNKLTSNALSGSFNFSSGIGVPISPVPPCLFNGLADINHTVSFPAPQFTVLDPSTYPPPTIGTKPASALTQTTATLNGTVTPNGLTTGYHFEYGVDKTYGTNAPAQDVWLDSNLNVAQSVARPVTGLLPGTTYHFRLVARNAKGTTFGPDQTFMTAPPPCDYNYSSSIRTGYINQDAKEDIYQFSSLGLWGWTSTGSASPPYTTGLGKIGSGFGSAYQDRLGDRDGDGDDDAFQVLDDGRVYEWLSNGASYSGGALIASDISVGGACEIRTLDMNGDGTDDLMRFTSGGNGYAWLSNGSTFVSAGQKGSGYGVPVEMRSADFTGDGKADLLRFLDNGNVYGWESYATAGTWTGFKALGTVGTGFGNNSEVQIGDANNDGKDDVFRFTDGGEGSVALSEAIPGGWQLAKPALISKAFGLSRQMKVADINGDGKADVLKFADDGVGYGWRATGSSPSITYPSIGTIGSGFGAP